MSHLVFAGIDRLVNTGRAGAGDLYRCFNKTEEEKKRCCARTKDSEPFFLL